MLKVAEDKDLVIADANQAACEILGYSREELLGRPIKDIDRSLDEEQNRAILNQVMSRESLLFETAHVRKDGTTFPVEVSAKLLDTGANSSLIISIERDITERKRTEEEIKNSNSLLSSVIESPDNVIIFALDTNYNYLSFNQPHVRDMNRAYGADIDIGQNILTYIPRTDDRLKAEENYKRVLKGDRFVKVEEYGRSSSRFWYELIYNPILDSLHHVVGFTVFVTDITERTQAEAEQSHLQRELQQAQKMEALGQLTGGIAHDFNNILGIMQGYTELAVNHAVHSGQAQLVGYLEHVEKAGGRAKELVDQMLAYSRSEARDDKSLQLQPLVEEDL
ncbi:MAG: PAS domain S-box protein, partial [Gammaproteobacteria bacterium]|nr:PAS domain S-box protein [Gammaproteobacteria bacterium]